MTDDSGIQYQEQQDWREVERRRVKRTRRTLIGVLIALVILLLVAFVSLLAIFRPVGNVAAGEKAAGVTWVRSIYGWGRTPLQQFQGPQGVGIGPDSTIWTTTQAQNRIVGFNPDGSVNAMLYKGPAGNTPQANDSFSYPVAVAVDPAGLIYIADQQKSTVWVVDKNNTVVRKIFVPLPSSIAVSNDRLVVGSGSGFVILTPTGTVVKLLGTQGRGVEQFEGVRGAAIGKDGTIYVVDQYNNRVSAYDRDGKRKWIVSTGTPGNQANVQTNIVPKAPTAPANMQIPAGLTIDGAGRLVIADPFGFDLTVLSPKDGKLIAKYGNPGSIDGQFVYPSSVAYDSFHDWFAVADTGNARVQIVRLPNSGGTVLTALNQTLAGPLGACLIPLLLLLLMIVAAIIYRAVQRRRRKREAAAAAAAAGAEVSG
jgi:sugar lactone lactonase YvrE